MQIFSASKRKVLASHHHRNKQQIKKYTKCHSITSYCVVPLLSPQLFSLVLLLFVHSLFTPIEWNLMLFVLPKIYNFLFWFGTKKCSVFLSCTHSRLGTKTTNAFQLINLFLSDKRWFFYRIFLANNRIIGQNKKNTHRKQKHAHTAALNFSTDFSPFVCMYIESNHEHPERQRVYSTLFNVRATHNDNTIETHLHSQRQTPLNRLYFLFRLHTRLKWECVCECDCTTQEKCETNEERKREVWWIYALQRLGKSNRWIEKRNTPTFKHLFVYSENNKSVFSDCAG